MKSRVLLRYLVVIGPLLGSGAPQVRAQDFATIYSRYQERVAHVEVIGKLFDGSQESSAGSGILIGYGLVLTNSHVIPNEQNFETMTVNVRLRSRYNAPMRVVSFERDKDRDLAILFLDPEADPIITGGTRCPMPALSEAGQVPPGTEIAVMGFPFNQDLSIARGLLSNQGGMNDDRWQTDALLNVGNSGGPFFSRDGIFTGVAVGGIVRYSIGGEEQDVVGVNFLIPTTVIRASPLFQRVSNIAEPDNCWSDYDPTAAFDPRYFDGGKARFIKIDYTFSATKDDHPVAFSSHSRVYSETYLSEPGYNISECSWSALSETRAERIRCDIGEGGAMARFSFELTSGPSIDRYRGWWTGTISLLQTISDS